MHSLDLELTIALAIQRPAGLLEQYVDIQIASTLLVVVVLIRAHFVGGLDLRDLCAQTGELGLQLGVLHARTVQPRILGGLLLLPFAKRGQCLLARHDAHRPRDRQKIEPKVRLREMFRCARVGARNPEEHVEELAQDRGRHVRRDRFGLVDRDVALFADQVHLGPDPLLDKRAETRREEHRREMSAIGRPQALLGVVNPLHRELQRTPGVEAGRARIGDGFPLGLRGFTAQFWPFGREEDEVAWDLAGLPCRVCAHLRTLP